MNLYSIKAAIVSCKMEPSSTGAFCYLIFKSFT
nr:MAG TPA: hypothetical protein [Caudoviricetes sp.]DAQ51601.1 MAG TPA: hypothetical protein [Caudoviricetes sp.]